MAVQTEGEDKFVMLDLDVKMTLLNSHVILVDSKNQTKIGECEEANGLYYLTQEHNPSVYTAIKTASDACIWHYRVGHPSNKLCGQLLSNVAATRQGSVKSDARMVSKNCRAIHQQKKKKPL
ncbi:hypothetical protein EJ110_NYTH27552 [Nymphaea thermarum]|nr:hypothetical protein EJ110_NYTH27552 [Nymphaea thermarum]